MTSLLRDLGRPFLFLWLAETILIGGGVITEFAVGAWVFRQSASLFEFSVVIAAGGLSTLLVLPLVGELVDRVERRKVILCADAVMLVCMCMLLAQSLGGTLVVWHLYLFTAVTAMAGACRGPAYRAAVSSQLSTQHLARGNGLIGISAGIAGLAAPLIGAAVMEAHDLSAIVAIHMTTLCASALLVLMALGGDRPRAACLSSVRPSAPSDHLPRRLGGALSYLGEHRSMLVLLVYGAVQATLVALVASLIAPLVLSKYSVRELGVVMTCGGLGALLGACPLFVPALSRRLAMGLLVCDAILGLCVLAAGVFHSLVQYMACSFIAMFAGSVATGCIHTLWMRKVPLDRQGSLFALTGTIAMVTMPTVALAAGIVVDRIVGPQLSPGGSWVDALGPWLGQGKGGGVALVFVICGGLALAASLGALAHKGIRNIDTLVPDGR